MEDRASRCGNAAVKLAEATLLCIPCLSKATRLAEEALSLCRPSNPPGAEEITIRLRAWLTKGLSAQPGIKFAYRCIHPDKAFDLIKTSFDKCFPGITVSRQTILSCEMTNSLFFRQLQVAEERRKKTHITRKKIDSFLVALLFGSLKHIYWLAAESRFWDAVFVDYRAIKNVSASAARFALLAELGARLASYAVALQKVHAMRSCAVEYVLDYCSRRDRSKDLVTRSQRCLAAGALYWEASNVSQSADLKFYVPTAAHNPGPQNAGKRARLDDSDGGSTYAQRDAGCQSDEECCEEYTFVALSTPCIFSVRFTLVHIEGVRFYSTLLPALTSWINRVYTLRLGTLSRLSLDAGAFLKEVQKRPRRIKLAAEEKALGIVCNVITDTLRRNPQCATNNPDCKCNCGVSKLLDRRLNAKQVLRQMGERSPSKGVFGITGGDLRNWILMPSLKADQATLTLQAVFSEACTAVNMFGVSSFHTFRYSEVAQLLASLCAKLSLAPKCKIGDVDNGGVAADGVAAGAKRVEKHDRVQSKTLLWAVRQTVSAVVTNFLSRDLEDWRRTALGFGIAMSGSKRSVPRVQLVTLQAIWKFFQEQEKEVDVALSYLLLDNQIKTHFKVPGTPLRDAALRTVAQKRKEVWQLMVFKQLYVTNRNLSDLPYDIWMLVGAHFGVANKASVLMSRCTNICPTCFTVVPLRELCKVCKRKPLAWENNDFCALRLD